VVDDDPDVRKGIETLVKSAGLSVKSYSSASRFLDACERDASGCLVLDVRMPGLDGLGLQKALAARGTAIPIVFITGHGSVPMSVQALKAGAVDFIEKPFDDEKLLQSIRRAMAMDDQSREHRDRRKVYEDRFALLTAREREVMGLLIAGKHTKGIAAELGISIKTVDKHRTKILQKMQVDTVVELVHLALSLNATNHEPEMS